MLEFLHHLCSAQMLLNALFKSQLTIFAQQCPINIAHQSLNDGFVCLIHDVSLLSPLSHHFSTATSISSRACQAVASCDCPLNFQLTTVNCNLPRPTESKYPAFLAFPQLAAIGGGRFNIQGSFYSDVQHLRRRPPFDIVETKFVILVGCPDKESAADIATGGTVDSSFKQDRRTERDLGREFAMARTP